MVLKKLKVLMVTFIMKNKPIAIIGAGNSGLAMAAHLTLKNETIRLWNRSSENIERLLKTRTVHCDGIIKANVVIEMITSDLKATLEDVELILVTTPANAHKDIALAMSAYLNGGELIVLNPGRTFGAVEFMNVLKQSGCKSDIVAAETQTSVYTCRKNDSTSVVIYAIKNDVLISGLEPSINDSIIRRLPDCLQSYFIAADNMIQTSIGNVGMILHCAPTLFNTGRIETPHVNFKYYESITPSLAALLEKLDQERVEVSTKLGKTVETITQWMRRSYNIDADTLYNCLKKNIAYRAIDAPTSLRHRYILEDVPCGLVPLEAIGHKLGLNMKVVGLVIDNATKLLGINFREEGRNLRGLGLEYKTPNEIAKIILGNHIKQGVI